MSRGEPPRLDAPPSVLLKARYEYVDQDWRHVDETRRMLRAVPAGADVYLVKRVLMDWGDEPAIRILRNCAQAIQAGGRVLVIECSCRRATTRAPPGPSTC